MRMIRKIFSLLLFAACFWAATRAEAKLSVVATTPDLAALASAVGGERVSVKALSSPTQDPHWVDAKPSLALELSQAELLLAVGAELELGWLPTLQLGSRNGRVQPGARGFLDCSTLVDLLERPTTRVDRSQGDIHPSGNPHYLLDPRAAERVAVGIGKRLAELDPEGTRVYLERTKAFVTSLRDARARWQKPLEKLKGRPIVAYHRSLAYLADWTGLVVVDHIESKPGVPPDPRHVAELIALARQKGVRAVVQEAFHATRTSQLVAEKLGGKLLRLSGATNFQGGQSYVAFIEQLLKQLSEGL
jgi:zinc/manganese transport system substrate-binding protein